MNPLIHEFLLAIIRKFITIAATWLVTEGFIGENDVEKYVAGFALMAVSLIWSLWSRYKDRINFLAALDAQPGTDEKEVKMKAKQFPPHSLVILLAAGLTLTSCASARRSRSRRWPSTGPDARSHQHAPANRGQPRSAAAHPHRRGG